MKNTYPILIGSQATLHHGIKFDKPPNDWDIVVNPQQKTKFNEMNKKTYYSEERMIFVEINSKIEKVDLIEKDYLHQLCNDFADDLGCTIINHKTFGELLIPPLEILYAIKKGHIHRIINHHVTNINNVKDWRDQVYMYSRMRKRLSYNRDNDKKLGYTLLDRIIYDVDGCIKNMKKDKDESLVDYYTRFVFLKTFEATNKLHGDAVSMDKTEAEFFKDGVPRLIEHDELHRLVANMCRDTDTLLFRKYIIGDGVEMDRSLFITDDKNIQMQTIREEIIVLYIERKLIPHMIMCSDRNIPYKQIIQKHLFEKMLTIIGHFMTNLCGNGHSWLRIWCIDHLSLFLDLRQYNHIKIEDIAKSITNVKFNTNHNKETLSFVKFINKGNCFNGWISKKPDYRLPYNSYKNTKLRFKYGNGKNVVDIKCIHLLGPGEHKNIILEFSYSNNSDIINMIIRKFVQSKYVYYCNHCIFDPHGNIGIINYSDGIKLFRLCGDPYSTWETSFGVTTMDLKGNTRTWEKEYIEKHYSYYYYSDADCEGMDTEVNFNTKYLSSYGDLPNLLNKMMTIFARESLEIYCDKKHKTGDKTDYGGYTIYKKHNYSDSD